MEGLVGKSVLKQIEGSVLGVGGSWVTIYDVTYRRTKYANTKKRRGKNGKLEIVQIRRNLLIKIRWTKLIVDNTLNRNPIKK